MTDKWPLWVVVEFQGDGSRNHITATLARTPEECWKRYKTMTCFRNHSVAVLPCRIKVKS